MAAALLELEDYKAAALLTETLLKRHPDSPLADQFLYMHAFCVVLAGRLRARDRRRPQGRRRQVPQPHRRAWWPARTAGWRPTSSARSTTAGWTRPGAIACYEKVADRFADAKEAIEYFTRKDLSLDEVKTFVPRQGAGRPARRRRPARLRADGQDGAAHPARRSATSPRRR